MFFILVPIVLWVTFVVVRKIARATKAVATSSKEAVANAKASVSEGLSHTKGKAAEKGAGVVVKALGAAEGLVDRVDTEKVAARIGNAKTKAETAKVKGKATADKAKVEAKAAFRSLRAKVAEASTLAAEKFDPGENKDITEF